MPRVALFYNCHTLQTCTAWLRPVTYQTQSSRHSPLKLLLVSTALSENNTITTTLLLDIISCCYKYTLYTFLDLSCTKRVCSVGQMSWGKCATFLILSFLVTSLPFLVIITVKPCFYTVPLYNMDTLRLTLLLGL